MRYIIILILTASLCACDSRNQEVAVADAQNKYFTQAEVNAWFDSQLTTYLADNYLKSITDKLSWQISQFTYGTLNSNINLHSKPLVHLNEHFQTGVHKLATTAYSTPTDAQFLLDAQGSLDGVEMKIADLESIDTLAVYFEYKIEADNFCHDASLSLYYGNYGAKLNDGVACDSSIRQQDFVALVYQDNTTAAQELEYLYCYENPDPNATEDDKMICSYDNDHTHTDTDNTEYDVIKKFYHTQYASNEAAQNNNGIYELTASQLPTGDDVKHIHFGVNTGKWMAIQLTFNLIDYVGNVTKATAESMPNINIKLDATTEIIANINHSHTGATQTTNTNNNTKVDLKFIAQGNKYSVKNIHICKLDTDGSEATADCNMPDISSTPQFQLYKNDTINNVYSPYQYQLAYGGATEDDVINNASQYFVVQLEHIWHDGDNGFKWDSTPDGKRNLFYGDSLVTTGTLYCQHGAVDLYQHMVRSGDSSGKLSLIKNPKSNNDSEDEKYFPYVRATACQGSPSTENGYTYKFINGVYTTN